MRYYSPVRCEKDQKMKIKTSKKPETKKTVAKKCTKCVAKKTAAKKPALKDVTFTVHADKGKSVYLAGVFNPFQSLTAQVIVAISGRPGKVNIAHLIFLHGSNHL